MVCQTVECLSYCFCFVSFLFTDTENFNAFQNGFFSGFDLKNDKTYIMNYNHNVNLKKSKITVVFQINKCNQNIKWCKFIYAVKQEQKLT